MNKSVLLCASIVLAGCLFPSVSLGNSILPPPCCNRYETTTDNPQPVLIQNVSQFLQSTASPTEGIGFEQETLAFRIPANLSEVESLEVLNQLYVSNRKTHARIPIVKKNPPDRGQASS
jgi:hypothetical protein